jgi:hypothetical protein
MKAYMVPTHSLLQNLCFFFSHRKSNPAPAPPPPPPPPPKIVENIVKKNVEKIVEKIVYVYIEKVYIKGYGEVLI